VQAVAAQRVSAARAWWSAVRPATLAASVAPVLTATALAVHHGTPRLVAGLGALVVALAIQLGVNFANDYSDFVRGADAKRVGPLRAASSGAVAPRDVRRAAIAAFAMASVVGLAISLAYGWQLIVVGGACIVAAWLYTGGPRPYGYLGLGEVFVFVFFGLVATAGTYYVESGGLSPLPVVGPAACAMGFLATAILVLNNLRDIETDAAAGKRTLATRIGRDATRTLLLLLVCAAFAMPIVLFVSGRVPVTIMAVHFAIPIAAVPVRTAFATTSPPALVGALKRMGIAQLAYALLFSLGLLL